MPEEPQPDSQAAPPPAPTFGEVACKGLRERFPEEVIDASAFREDWTITVRKHRILEILTYLRDDPEIGLNFLVDVTAVDLQGYVGADSEFRFAVVYNLCSYRQAAHRGRVRVKAVVPEREAIIASACSVWKGAEWPEREVYDMFGIRFEGHPDLRRILMPVNFQDYPLRKDYPLRGKGERDVIAPEDPGFVSIDDVTRLRDRSHG